MSLIEKLASSLNRRDEVPNQELAKEIAGKSDTTAIKELIENLHNKNKDIQNDCIKVLYEIGTHKAFLIAEYAHHFVALLSHKNNRLQWGAMTAIDTITLQNPKLVYEALPKIIACARNGSVITKDNAVNILIKLCSLNDYAGNTFPLLSRQLLTSSTNQLPMYAEKALPVINNINKAEFISILTSRLADTEKDTKRKRVEKVIKKLGERADEK